jgi:hypothetical protein
MPLVCIADIRMSETLADQDSTPVCALKKEGPIMDTVLSFLISAGIFAFGVWVVAGTIAAGWPLASLMGLLAAIVGLLGLFGSAQIAGVPRSN